MVEPKGFHDYVTYRVKAIPPEGTYLEIGTLDGGSLLAAYEGSVVSGNPINFIAIDWYFKDILEVYQDQFKRLVERCAHISNLRYIKDNAYNVADEVEDNSIDVLLEDSDPSYENLVRHIQLYWPKLKDGGVWLGHDYGTFSGVTKGYNEAFRNDGRLLSEGSSLFIMEKVKGYKLNC